MAVALVAAAFVACSPGSGATQVTLDEFSIGVSRPSVAAGQTRFDVRNAGDIPHTFYVVRTRLAESRLPVKEGLVVLERLAVTGAIRRQLGSGTTSPLTLDLAPGRYVLICDIAGHYQSGMHTGFRVR